MLLLADCRQAVGRTREVAVCLRVLGRGPERDLRRVRRLFEISLFVFELGDDLGSACAVRLRQEKRSQRLKGVRHVAAAIVVDAFVPDLAVGHRRLGVLLARGTSVENALDKVKKMREELSVEL